jgi:hypothetical protein
MSQFRNGPEVLYLTRRPQDFKMSIFDIINGSLVGKLRLGTDKRQAFFFSFLRSCVLAFLRGKEHKVCASFFAKCADTQKRKFQCRQDPTFKIV